MGVWTQVYSRYALSIKENRSGIAYRDILLNDAEMRDKCPSIITDMRAVLKVVLDTRAVSKNEVSSKTELQSKKEELLYFNLKKNLPKFENFGSRQYPSGRKSLGPYSRERSPLNRKRKRAAQRIMSNTTEDTLTMGWSQVW